MNDFVAAVGLVLVLEGVFYAAAPPVAKELMRRGQAVPDHVLRAAGLVALVLGVGIVWLARF